MKKGEISLACSKHGSYEIHTKILVENSDGKDNLEDRDVNGWIILEWILGKESEKLWTVFIWLRRGASGRLL
jgi:hypothetical protein